MNDFLRPLVAVSACLALVTCGRVNSTAVPNVQSVTISESVIGQDELDPLAQGVTPKMQFDQVFAYLQKQEGYAPYLSDPSQLRVRLGLYKYSWKQGQNLSAVAYVISGGQAVCEPNGGGPPPAVLASGARLSTPTVQRCSAILVVNADTGDVLVMQERGLPQ